MATAYKHLQGKYFASSSKEEQLQLNHLICIIDKPKSKHWAELCLVAEFCLSMFD